MPNETDKQELSEETLQKWYAGPIDVICTYQNLRTVIDALRATWQELDSYLAEEITYGNPRLLDKRITELEHQVGARDLVINSARIGEQHNRERIEELIGVLEWLDRQGGLGLDKHAMIRAALAKKEEKDATAI